MKYEMINNANVELTKTFDQFGNIVAEVIINDQYQHQFKPRSIVSRSLRVATPEQVEKRLQNGSFFIVEGSIIDYKDNRYKGFKHNDDAIAELMSNIGVSLNRQKQLVLKKTWNVNELDIDTFNEGGTFTFDLNYSWSPFRPTVDADFFINRLVCLNGHTARSQLMNSKIPLFNRWFDHLQIASVGFNTSFNNLLKERLTYLSKVRASIGQVNHIQRHIETRLQDETLSQDVITRLNNIAEVTSSIHYEKFFKPAALENTSIANQLPSHLTGLDLYNLTTEVSSHSAETERSSQFALDRFASNILFDHTDKHMNRFVASGHISPFDNHKQAFFG